MTKRRIEILLVEDDPGHARLMQEAFKEGRFDVRLHLAVDGIEAVQFLRRQESFAGAPRPDLILLDLNLPRKDGREVLVDIKADSELKSIPVIVISMSSSEPDILHSYDNHANCYIRKPVELEAFFSIVRTIEEFWLTVAQLPPVSSSA